MFKKHYKKRSGNIPFTIFRLILSLVMFAVLIAGSYSAYKHFSGLDPLKLDPISIFREVIAARTPQQLTDALSSIKISPNILGRSVEKNEEQNLNREESSSKITGKTPIFRFLLIADSHSDNFSLQKAISQAKNTYPDLQFIIGMGDYTKVGTKDELKDAKKVLDSLSLRYFLIPGDHDLWDCRNKNLLPEACFSEFFGPPYQSFSFYNFQFLLLNNSDNYKGLDNQQLKWIADELEKARQNQVRGVFVFMHEPLYHPYSDRVMGKVESSLKQQARDLMFQLKSAGVKQIFAGDIHFFSQYAEPVTGLEMSTIGAVTIERNPQPPRFAVVSVYEDGQTKIEDVEIK